MASRVTSTRLIGRGGELAELAAAIDDAGAGRPSVVFVGGDSGVGKTRLMQELSALAKTRGARVECGDCVELGDDELPYAPLVAALRPLVRDADPALEALPAAARAELATLLPELGGEARAAQLDGDRPGGGAQARLFEALLSLLERLGREGPLLLWLEDIHWADRSTRAFLAFLTRNLWTERLLVVATYRSDELHRRHPLRPLLAELERLPQTRRVDLHPLTSDELGELLADVLGERPDEELRERLFARSEGNPLFAEELLAAGLDGNGALPSSLRDALMVRVERLDPATQEVLRVLAVGRSLAHETIAQASGADAADLRAALREAAEAHIIAADERGGHRFRHALLREVVHDDLLPGERSDLNLRLARALETRVPAPGEEALIAAGIAHHYLAAGDQPAAFAAALHAAETAERVHAYGEAAVQLDRALDLWGRVPDPETTSGGDRAALLGRAGRALLDDGEYARAEKRLARAGEEIDAAQEPHRAAGLLHNLSQARWRMGKPDAARETIDRAAALLGDEDVSAERARILAWNAKTRMLQSRYRETLPIARAAIEVGRQAGDGASLGTALNVMGVALISIGDIDEGVAALEEAIELAVDDAARQSGHINLADSLHLVGRSADALRIAHAGLALEARSGDVCTREFLELVTSEVEWDLGHWDAARVHLEGAPIPGQSAHAFTQLRRTEIALADGRHDDAAAALDRAATFSRGSREPQLIGLAGSLRAELERRRGDLAAARNAVDDALDAIEFCSDDLARIAKLAHVGGRIEAEAAERARDLADPEAERLAVGRAEGFVARLEACAEDYRPVEAARLLSGRAALLGARGSGDPAAHEAAADAWATMGWPYASAIERLLAAQAQAARGERDAAAATIAAACAAARELGAPWLLAELEGLAARARLPLGAVAAGSALEPADAGSDAGVPEPEAVADPFGLTPRERQVLALVAEGATNREVGQQLYMAEKTASVHVSRILAKLDVRSRTEAAAVAHRLGLTAPGPRSGDG